MGPAMRVRSLLVALVLAAVAACSTTTTETPSPAGDAGAADAGPPLPALGMNDVSVLLPIPTKANVNSYLGPTSEGSKGPLLSQASYDKIPKFGMEPVEGLDYALMRAVGIRFDACFPGPAGCEPQIRIVMQPITPTGDALDSAIHLFYRLTEEEIAKVVVRLRQLRALAPEMKDQPLQVNPAIVAQGVDGAYGAALRELVLEFAGEQNFSRMTFFLRAPPIQEEWFFGGFDRKDGVLTTLDIVGVGKGNQRVDRPETPEGYEYVFTPAGNKPENTSALVVSATAKTAPPDQVKAALEAFVRIENPTKYGPDALPCAGCHVSTVVTEFAKASLGLDPDALPDAFKSTRDLSLSTEAGKTPKSLRAFGWFEKKAMISKRVVNESAAVADDLETRFPRNK